LNMKLAGHLTLENVNSIQHNRDSWERVACPLRLKIMYRSRTELYHRRAENVDRSSGSLFIDAIFGVRNQLEFIFARTATSNLQWRGRAQYALILGRSMH